MAEQRADLCLVGGTVVTDGRTVPANVYLRDGTIAGVDERCAAVPQGVRAVDVTGHLVLPGLVNHHAHGCTTGPLFSSGAQPLTQGQAHANADRHLRAGVTTLVNVCGFPLPHDVPDHPLQILLATTHLPAAVAAAEIVDAAGLDRSHRDMTAERMLELGAVALGEIGSGATLGGGVAAYRYVPQAVRDATGVSIDPHRAEALIDALIGPLRTAEPDDPALRAAMRSAGLAEAAAPAVRAAILRYAAAPVAQSLHSFGQAAVVSQRTGVPAVFHTAAPSVREVLRIARTTGARVVAGHMNHTSLAPDEAVSFARDLADAGAAIDVSSLDIVSRRRLATPEVADVLADAGLVDTLTTDYAGGEWEPMLALVRRWTAQGRVGLAAAVAMCTSTPAALLGLHDRGSIRPGRKADIAVVRAGDVAAVELVLISGIPVHATGRITLPGG